MSALPRCPTSPSSRFAEVTNYNQDLTDAQERAKEILEKELTSAVSIRASTVLCQTIRVRFRVWGV